MTKGNNTSVILLPMGVKREKINQFAQELENKLETDEKKLLNVAKQSKTDIIKKDECSFRTKCSLRMYVYAERLLTQNNIEDVQEEFENLVVAYSSGFTVESIQSILEINRIAKVIAEIDCKIEFFKILGENIIDKNNQLETKQFEEKYNELNSQLEEAKLKIKPNVELAFSNITDYVIKLKNKNKKNNIPEEMFDTIENNLIKNLFSIKEKCDAEINIGMKKLEGIKNTEKSAKLELATIKMWFKRTQISIELISYYLNLLKNFKNTVIYQYEIDLDSSRAYNKKTNKDMLVNLH